MVLHSGTDWQPVDRTVDEGHRRDRGLAPVFVDRNHRFRRMGSLYRRRLHDNKALAGRRRPRGRLGLLLVAPEEGVDTPIIPSLFPSSFSLIFLNVSLFFRFFWI